MQPSRDEALFAVQQVVLGERTADEPSVVAALAAFPDLAAELDGLLQVRARLDDTGADAAQVEDEARSAITTGDRDTVRRLLGTTAPARRPWLLALAAAAVLGLGVVAWQIGSRDRAADGMLEPTPGVVVDRTGPTWVIDPGMQLPPGTEYLVTLEIGGSPAAPPQSFPCPIQLPAAWQQLVDRASTPAGVLVEVPELGWRQRVRLR